MAEAYIGSAVLEVDGREIEIVKLDVKENTGRKLVKTMNSQGVALGFAQGIAEYNLSVTAAIPLDSEAVDWASITDGKLTFYPLNQPNKRISFLGCFTTEVGQSYTVDNEANQDIQMQALKKVVE